MGKEFMRGRPDRFEDWFGFAERDVKKAATDLTAGESIYAVIFLQQSAEKFLKGKMVQLGDNPGKTHNLPYLLTELAKLGLDLEWFRETGEFLSYEYLAERYPGDFDPPPSDDEVATALEEAKKLSKQINP